MPRSPRRPGRSPHRRSRARREEPLRIWPVVFVALAVAVEAAPPAPPAPPAAGPPVGGPFTHRIGSASSRDGLSWTRDEGVRLEHASVPCAVADGDRVLLYQVDADRGPGKLESTGCAVSTDGLAFAKQP